ncbi:MULTISPECIES: response regulator transcription factor [Clostridium]|uniref:Stage 0 sporulation protein A homolog n=2 Tax=Clostridium TaxID=1485 RepID=D8GPD0_CLOLD|nr:MULTISPECIES: response regulator transcription factor [Clostridium]ADK16008.1 predicted two-component response regulator [Clostridium ljungdahlii DSM 13528]AGY75181.1 response regulator transcription factor [Clostridium autoethanogenum DSM 10061]ALU35353.1 Two component transcriptional regulator winged helix family [Clostridium autoethanogenum DSM 10061]OAA87117.1 Transcriptional regulatory protein SrrA [Clostridium ljungdahlii DSM 13528]OVY49568.1 Transcriptional regulatory protein SrrA [C
MDKNILIADDNIEIIKILKPYIEKEGFTVIFALDGEEALLKFNHYNPQLILLDIMMPLMDGIEVCNKIREKSNTPIIMITAKSEDADKILGLNSGADDYIVKPFSPGEVVARIKAVLRRITFPESNKMSLIKYESLELDIDNYSVKLKGKNINLTKKEIEVLWMLSSSPNKIVSRDDLLDNIWGVDYFGDPRTVDTHIKRIRSKLHLNGQYNWDIKTIWAIGYKFEVKDV